MLLLNRLKHRKRIRGSLPKPHKKCNHLGYKTEFAWHDLQVTKSISLYCFVQSRIAQK